MGQGNEPKPGTVLVYLVTEDWYFLSHRLPMAREAKRTGYDVHVVTQVRQGRAAIEAEGFHVHPVVWRRGSVNPFGFLSNILAVRARYRALRPAIVHHVALQPTVVGSLAATGLPCMRLNALAGLGFAFTSSTLKAWLVRPVLRVLLRLVLRHPRASVLVQNPDDAAAVRDLGVSQDSIFTIPGSGVDTDSLLPMPEPEGPVTVAFVGRLLDDKGIRTLVAAHSLLAREGNAPRLLIAGEPDPANPVSIPPQEVAGWKQQPGIEVLGHVADIRAVWVRAHIAVLTSRREGLPKSLLEAAACGRPLVATDVPGCREIAREGVNASLVPPDDASALATAIGRLVREPMLRASYGEAGRKLVEREFSTRVVATAIRAVYGRLVGMRRA